MRYKATVPAHVEARVVHTKTTCDGRGKDVENGQRYYTSNEVTVEAKIGDVFPETDARTYYEVDVCADCFVDKVVPALAAIGFKVRTRDTHEDERVWDQEAPTAPPAERTILLNPMQHWNGGSLSAPTYIIHRMLELANFAPVVFCMSAKTAHVFLDHPATIDFVRKMDVTEVLERRSRAFTIRGLASFEVVDGVADGIVSMVDAKTRAEIGRVTGAIA